MNAAVVLCLDRNRLVEQDGRPPEMYLYEAEAVSCARSWRGAAGWTDPIYAVQYRGREVSPGTESALGRLGVRIVGIGDPPRGRMFMEVVAALAAAESGAFIKEGRIVYSDLDVVMKAPVPAEFLLPGGPCLFYYPGPPSPSDPPEFAYRLAEGARLGYRCRNTYFQTFDVGGGLQRAVLEAAGSAGYAEFFRDHVYYAPKDDDYFFEEGAYDYVCDVAGLAEAKDFPCPAAFFDHVHAHRRTLRAAMEASR